MLNGFNKDLMTLRRFYSDPKDNSLYLREVIRCIRPSIEGIFRLKYYNYVKDNEWLGDFIAKIRDSNESSPYYRLKEYIDEIEEINDYCKQYHHSNPNYLEVNISSIELKNYVRRNGDGIVDTFGTFLASKKNSLSLMKSKANKGKGRFSFTAIASEATWKTVYKQGDNYLLFNIFLSNRNKNLVDYNDPKISDEKETGTTITLSNIIDLLPENISMLHLEDTLLKKSMLGFYI